MKRQRYAWVTLLPAAWLIVCTMTAGLMKLFSPDPAIGFLAHAERFSAALGRGEVLAPAKSLAEMNQVIWNDRIDAALCALFVLVVASILVFAVRACLRAYGLPRWSAVEVPPQPVAAE